MRHQNKNTLNTTGIVGIRSVMKIYVWESENNIFIAWRDLRQDLVQSSKFTNYETESQELKWHVLSHKTMKYKS